MEEHLYIKIGNELYVLPLSLDIYFQKLGDLKNKVIKEQDGLLVFNPTNLTDQEVYQVLNITFDFVEKTVGNITLMNEIDFTHYGSNLTTRDYFAKELANKGNYEQANIVLEQTICELVIFAEQNIYKRNQNKSNLK